MSDPLNAWIDQLFWWCVRLLETGAALLGISYEALNIAVFVVLHPLVTLGLLGVVLVQRRQLRRLTLEPSG